MHSKTKALLRRGVWLLVVAAVIVLVITGPTDAVVVWIEQQVVGAGVWAPVIFWCLFVLFALLCMPGSGTTIVAGAVFGLWAGTALASTATVASAALSYGLMRTTLADRVEVWLKSRPKLMAVYRAIQDGDWRLVGVMRLSPLLPLGPSNYVFALARMRLLPYLAVTWLATLPSKLMWAYLGSAGRQGLTVLSKPSAVDPAELAYLGLGLVATVAGVMFLGVLANRRLKTVVTSVD